MICDSDVGKQAEAKIKEWLNRPQDGYSFDRVYDQMTGFYGSKNICDFTVFKSPNIYYIESKATWADRFDFSMLTETQHDGLLLKSQISNVYGYVVVLFATYQRAFVINIQEIKKLEDSGKKSLNIKKLATWGIEYYEIPTAPSRKKLLSYVGEIPILPKITIVI